MYNISVENHLHSPFSSFIWSDGKNIERHHDFLKMLNPVIIICSSITICTTEQKKKKMGHVESHDESMHRNSQFWKQ